MDGEPGIATVAALIGDTGRAAMLTALVDGRALPAGELAAAQACRRRQRARIWQG